MSTVICLYNFLLLIALVFILPYYAVKSLTTGKYRRNLAARLGRVRVDPPSPGERRLWIHAVSVGEVTAAAAIIRALKEGFPQVKVILSTTTETGQEMARRIVPEAGALIYFPLDLPFVVGSLLDRVRPEVVVLTETELWPNFLAACRRRNIPVLLVNGRLSERSFKRYRQTRWFWGFFFTGIAGAGMIGEMDARRLIEMGVEGDKVWVMGNAKYDALAARVEVSLARQARALIGLKEGEEVFVAGSTHRGEEEVVLSVYRRLLADFPELKLIIVPRHIERTGELIDLCREKGFSDFITYREILGGKGRTRERVILVDVIGELFKLYGLATVVFCGGSLVPRGGQNILEAAAWGKVPLFGPYMADFTLEKELLTRLRGGIMVQDGQELYEKLRELLLNPELREEMGGRAAQAVLQNRGAARRYGELILSFLREKNA